MSKIWSYTFRPPLDDSQGDEEAHRVAMQKTQRGIPNPPIGTVVQSMPRAPAVIAALPLSAPMLALHPLAVHQDRVSRLHTHFLVLEEHVHRDFLQHRQRMLDGLKSAWEHRSIDGEPSSPMTFPTEVSWDDSFLDSHVTPAGMLLEPAGRVVGLPSLEDARAMGFGTLECDLAYLGSLPAPGETILTEVDTDEASTETGERELRLQIASRTVGGTRPLLTVHVRYSPGGAESTSLLAPLSAMGAPATQPHPWAWTRKGRFSDRDLDTLVAGDVFTCFGVGFERAASHTRTPPLPGARLVRLTSVDALEPAGGPWSMGSLRAHAASGIANGRFRDDLGVRLARLYQGALQTLAFFVMAAGGSIERDGWRFEPIVGHLHRLHVGDLPDWEASLEYELVVERFEGPPFAAIVGDVKAWVGEKLVFFGQRIGLKLVPDWPLTSDRVLLADAAADDVNLQRAAEIEGFSIGYRSLLAGALGRPSDAFREPGTFFETGARQMPRLPGPPYHFITRVTAVEGERLTMRPGAKATMEYDVPPDAWYFDENGNRTMPFCVLLEAALQPCGWLSVYVGCPLTTNVDVLFRNLDGAAMTMTSEVLPDSGTLQTRAKVTSVTRVSGVMLLSYEIECSLADRRVCHLNAMFGYFPKEALAQQLGLPTTDEQRAQLTADSAFTVDFGQRQERYFSGPLRLPGPMLLMIDRVSGYWPKAGAAGKGRLRAEKDVKPSDWFFKAHFYSDPVQPGSLGLEMMLQLLQFFVLEEDLGKGIEQPYFEPLALDTPVSWKFRGQVRPENKRIVTDIEIVSIESLNESVMIIANGSLWVDGLRCYEAKRIGVRVRGGRQVPGRPPSVTETVLDPAIDRWVSDHRPSYTVPVMPGMSMVDRLAAAALAHVRAAYPPADRTPDWAIVGVDDVRHHGWLVCDVPKRLRTDVTLLSARALRRIEEVETTATLYELSDDQASPPRRVSAGRVRLARQFGEPPPAWAPLGDAVPAPSPYEKGSIFWGPRLQVLRRLALGTLGASADLDAGGADAPIGALHPILLDGTLHAIPHDGLERWSPKIAPGHMGVPVRLTARFFGPPPQQGIMRAEVRFAGFDGATAFPVFLIQIIDPQGRVWASLRHIEVLVPMTHPRLSKEHREPFLVQRRFHEGVGLSEFHPDRTELHESDVKRMDGLPGSVAHVYGLERGAGLDARIIAIKDHVAQRARLHPGRILVGASLADARCAELPLTRFPVSVEQRGGDVIVRDAGLPKVDLEPLRLAWRRRGLHSSQAALERFLKRMRGVALDEPSALDGARIIFLSARRDPEEDELLVVLVSAIREHPLGAVFNRGQPPSSALSEAKTLLEKGAWVLVSGWETSAVAAPLASIAADCSAIVLPLEIQDLDDGVFYRIGASIPLDELRTRDHHSA
jgi:3-hydroxymyristoyl/3-hydroxydecanoyl-(acyl carrier protein) dehydratase